MAGLSSLLSSAARSRLSTTRCRPQLFLGFQVRHHASVATFEETFVRDALEHLVAEKLPNQQVVIDERRLENCRYQLLMLVRCMKTSHETVERALRENLSVVKENLSEVRGWLEDKNGRIEDKVDDNLRQLKRLLQTERLRSSVHLLEVLKARDRKHARGLFEFLEEMLKEGLPREAVADQAGGLQGAGLWEAILSSNKDLMTCVARCLGLPPTPSNLNTVASHTYQVYATLSSAKVTDGGADHLDQALEVGTLYFLKGPLSSQQARILEWVAAFCGYPLTCCNIDCNPSKGV